MNTPDGFVEQAYADKRRDYYDIGRPEMVPFLPEKCARLLDVGCGAGAFGAAIKRIYACEAWGVEPDAAAAALARTRLDQVHHGLFSPEAELPEAAFDCIVFNDVLEHMLDPAAALAYARALLRAGGVVVASIPNIGHFPTIWRLVAQGKWEYTERGILDRTHLRFFTQSSIRKLFETNFYNVEIIHGINAYAEMVPADRRLWKYYKLFSLLPSRGLKDMKYLQFGVKATLR